MTNYEHRQSLNKIEGANIQFLAPQSLQQARNMIRKVKIDTIIKWVYFCKIGEIFIQQRLSINIELLQLKNKANFQGLATTFRSSIRHSPRRVKNKPSK